jgi:murein DD-endopeptidase MepM/ murein hydrolase activator NlpD
MLSVKRFTDRFQRWLVPGLLATFVGITAIVATTCVLIHSPGGRAAPAVGAQPADFSPRSRLNAASPEPTPVSRESGLEFVWPADGNVSQGMTPKHPTGIDIAVTTGSDVRAARAGVVFFVGGDPCCSYGNYIVVGHDDGWASVYGHLSKFLVKAGDQVKQGQVIGLSGETGHANGPHVHFELRSFGRAVNPLDRLWPPRSAPPYVPDTPVATPASPPAPQTVELRPEEATSLAIGWMTQNAQYAYAIDASSCYAMQVEINWLVTCKGALQGCAGAACETYLSACVLEQPRLIARFC